MTPRGMGSFTPSAPNATSLCQNPTPCAAFHRHVSRADDRPSRRVEARDGQPRSPVNAEATESARARRGCSRDQTHRGPPPEARRVRELPPDAEDVHQENAVDAGRDGVRAVVRDLAQRARSVRGPEERVARPSGQSPSNGSVHEQARRARDVHPGAGAEPSSAGLCARSSAYAARACRNPTKLILLLGAIHSGTDRAHGERIQNRFTYEKCRCTSVSSGEVTSYERILRPASPARADVRPAGVAGCAARRDGGGHRGLSASRSGDDRLSKRKIKRFLNVGAPVCAGARTSAP